MFWWITIFFIECRVLILENGEKSIIIDWNHIAMQTNKPYSLKLAHLRHDIFSLLKNSVFAFVFVLVDYLLMYLFHAHDLCKQSYDICLKTVSVYLYLVGLVQNLPNSVKYDGSNKCWNLKPWFSLRRWSINRVFSDIISVVWYQYRSRLGHLFFHDKHIVWPFCWTFIPQFPILLPPEQWQLLVTGRNRNRSDNISRIFHSRLCYSIAAADHG